MRSTLRSVAATVVAMIFGAAAGAIAEYAAFRLGFQHHGVGELTTAIVNQWVLDKRRHGSDSAINASEGYDRQQIG